MEYLIVFFYLLIGFFVFDLLKIRFSKSRVWIIFGYVLFVSLAGFRFRIGFDTINYMRYFEEMDSLIGLSNQSFEIQRFQPLWVILVAISKSISREFYMLQLVVALFFNYCVFKFLSDNKVLGFFSMALYFSTYYFYFNFEILRESISVGIFLLSLNYYLTRSWWKYYLLITISFFFHSSAFVLFLFPIFNYVNRKFLIIFLICFITWIIFDFSVFFDFLVSVFMFESSFSYYDIYLQSLSNLNIKGVILDVFKVVLVPLFLYAMNVHSGERMQRLRPFLLLSFVVGVLSLFIPIFVRINSYFYIIYLMFISDYFYHKFFVRKNNLYFNLSLFLVLFGFYWNLLTVSLDRNDKQSSHKLIRRYLPYSHVFNPQTDQIRESYAY